MEPGILPPELKSIEQLFTGDAIFSVPKYQRSFAWGADEIEELWEDLISASERKGDYFLGTIVLQKRGPNTYEIIDGQQRLTCITMIFSAIRNVYLAARDKRAEKIQGRFMGATDFSLDSLVKPKLVLNRINNELFVQHVIGSNNSDAVEKALKAKKLPEPNKLLLQAYKYFLDKVTSESGKRGTRSDDFIVPLIDCLRSSAKLITITVATAEDANLFFESLNARGKELAVSDLVKNRLYTEAVDDLERAQQLWEQMENELARKPIPEYLRHYWIAKKVDVKNLIVREKKLYQEITQNIKESKTATLDLLVDLQSSASDYIKISDSGLWPEESAYDQTFGDNLNRLTKLFHVSQCNPLLLNAIQNFKTPDDVAKTFQIVTNFSFRYFIIGNQSPGSLERETGSIARGIRIGDISGPNDVANAFRSINPDLKFRDDFALATLTKSRAKIARYALAKINNYMARKAKPSGNEQVVDPDAKHVNLEHILPQSFSPTWQSDFSKGAEPVDYVYRIGNLTLLNKKLNSDAGNASFADKKRLALNDSSLNINVGFRTLNKWGDAEIEHRQNELAKIAVEVWRL